MANEEPNILVAFFDGTGTDHQRRFLEEIIHWPDHVLEDCHDYIQTLFPLPEPSRFSTNSILIDEEVFIVFRANEELRDSLRRAFHRIICFYGLEPQKQNGKLIIRRADNFCDRAQNWVVRVDHNHLRITRIIRSLRILGLEEEAEAFFQVLSDIYIRCSDRSRPSKESMKFWTRAAKRPLNFAPDVNDISDPKLGEEFLVRFEEARAEAEGEMSRLSGAADEDDEDGGVRLPVEELPVEE